MSHILALTTVLLAVLFCNLIGYLHRPLLYMLRSRLRSFKFICKGVLDNVRLLDPTDRPSHSLTWLRILILDSSTTAVAVAFHPKRSYHTSQSSLRPT
ncbi:hypothetical protein BKA82DRAFT_2966889 [Pisolithus tinctorius]|nr:hypothetical protein BKA82DRAFT_2966889 [Pisolithus tinctorius]